MWNNRFVDYFPKQTKPGVKRPEVLEELWDRLQAQLLSSASVKASEPLLDTLTGNSRCYYLHFHFLSGLKRQGRGTEADRHHIVELAPLQALN